MRNNPKGDTSDDYNFARCKRCGFPLDKSRDKTVRTEQISRTAPVGTTDAAAPYDFTIKAGCPFCGTPQPYE